MKTKWNCIGRGEKSLFLDFSVFQRGFLYALTFKKYAEPDSEEVHSAHHKMLQKFRCNIGRVQKAQSRHQCSATQFTPGHQKLKTAGSTVVQKEGWCRNGQFGWVANFSSFFTKYSIMGNEYSKIHCMVLKNWWSISALWGPLTEGVPSASSYSSKTSWLGFWNPSHWIMKSVLIRELKK